MNIVFADCFSGISGDMLLGALIDIGIDRDWLCSELSHVGFGPFLLEITKVQKGGILCTRCKVISQEPRNVSRGIQDIVKLIQKSPLKQSIKDQGLKIFKILADVEAKIHGVPVSEIHFHELGAVDSLVDILGVLIVCDHLEIERFYSSPLPLGRGIIKTRHGTIPIPAPATLALLEGTPVIHTGIEAELVTPTGAVLIKHLAKEFGVPPQMIVKKVGYGAGKRDIPDRPNCLRLISGQTDEGFEEEFIEILECDIDDMNPEFYLYIMETLFDAGALDVTLTQTIMKKGRPGIRMSVLGKIDSTQKLADILIKETTTIGVRINRVYRYKAPRNIKTIQTRYGPVRFKHAWKGNKLVNLTPEYEDYSKIAKEKNKGLKSVYQEIIADGLKSIGDIVDES